MNATCKRLLASVTLPLWAVGMTVIVSCLMVGHWVSLPKPEVGQTLIPTTAISQPKVSKEMPYTAFHFLYADCPCSRRVLTHVLDRAPVHGVAENLVIIGSKTEELAANALRQGFALDAVAEDELLGKYGVESAPLLVVVDQSGQIVYSGGYTSRKQGLDYHDVNVLQALLDGEAVENFPLYGCAVSERLKDLVDPLGIK